MRFTTVNDGKSVKVPSTPGFSMRMRVSVRTVKRAPENMTTAAGSAFPRNLGSVIRASAICVLVSHSVTVATRHKSRATCTGEGMVTVASLARDTSACAPRLSRGRGAGKCRSVEQSSAPTNGTLPPIATTNIPPSMMCWTFKPAFQRTSLQLQKEGKYEPKLSLQNVVQLTKKC